MEDSGIAIISAKSLHTEHDHHNQAFNADDLEKTGGEDRKSNFVMGDRNNGETATAKRDSNVEFSLPIKDHVKDRPRSFSTGPYRGMGKEELLRYSSKPLWRNLRYICMSIVITGWLALLITVVALVLTYPACRKAQERDWWQKAIIYRIYVRSFFDTDTDGIGDINGIRQKLGYLQSLGVDTISLSPIYKMSSHAHTDNHIVNHTEIDEIYGTLQDFKLLVNETHQKGIHIILDFIPNHTSDQHPWFLASKADKDGRKNLFRSYYVWTTGKGDNGLIQPNNWKSANDCSSAWTMNEENTFYLHQFLPSLPDLNLRSTKVQEALKDILSFWLDMGVDGFYIRDADYLFEDFDLRDNDNTAFYDCSNDAGLSDNSYTRGLTEIFDMFARWRAFLDDYGNKTSQYRILFADVDSSYDHVMKYYGLFNRDGVDFPLNKFSLQLNVTARGDGIRKIVSSWMDNMPKDCWANWMAGDDRSERLVDRLGENIATLYLILSMLLPGTPYVYYGDEIGLQAVHNSTHLANEWSISMPMRGPMQWNNRTFAGFCPQYCGHPWMDINPEYRNEMNVEAQMKNSKSLWNLFKNLTSLRRDKPSFEYGDYVVAIQDDEVFSFVREYDGERGYLIALNFAAVVTRKHFWGIHGSIPDSGKVEIVTGSRAFHSKDGNADLRHLQLAPFEGVVVSWDYHAKEL